MQVLTPLASIGFRALGDRPPFSLFAPPLRAMFKLKLCVTLALAALVGIPVAGAFALFSGIGFGDATYRSLHRHYALCDEVFAGGAALLVLIYLLDVSYWRGTLGRLARRVLVTAGAAGLAAGGVLATEKYPAAPFALFVLAVPLYIAFVHAACF
eukprot:g2690.t1